MLAPWSSLLKCSSLSAGFVLLSQSPTHPFQLSEESKPCQRHISPRNRLEPLFLEFYPFHILLFSQRKCIIWCVQMGEHLAPSTACTECQSFSANWSVIQPASFPQSPGIHWRFELLPCQWKPSCLATWRGEEKLTFLGDKEVVSPLAGWGLLPRDLSGWLFSHCLEKKKELISKDLCIRGKWISEKPSFI